MRTASLAVCVPRIWYADSFFCCHVFVVMYVILIHQISVDRHAGQYNTHRSHVFQEDSGKTGGNEV